jgi:ATP-binding cassette, subfamily G (WHITE), member 2
MSSRSLLLIAIAFRLISSMAEMVVKTLRVAANAGTTVILAIHQPSSAVFKLFDKLLLLSEGEAAYFGPV